MATSMTFTSLRSDIADMLERGQSEAKDPIFYPQIPKSINNAERRIARDLKVQGLLQAVTTNLQLGQAVYAKPNGWRQTISMNFGGGEGNVKRMPILPRSYEFLRTFWPDDTQTGAPRFYADYDLNHWVVAPSPEEAFPLEILYYSMPPLLDETNDTNWLTETAPSLLLYAALIEASIFLKMDDRAAAFANLYRDALQATSAEDTQKVLDRASTRRSA